MRFARRCILAALSLGVVLAAACKSEGDDGSASRALLADMTGAVGIAVTKAAAPSSSFAAMGGTTTTAEAFSSLVKIDEDGNVSTILDQSRPVFHATVTVSHVLVSGDFHDILDVSGVGLDCYFVAIPRTAAGEPVKCLSQEILSVNYGGADVDTSELLVIYRDKPGFVVRGDSTYFAAGGGAGAVTELRRWIGGADETELLIRLEPDGLGPLSQPFAIDSAPNLCVVRADGALGQTLCGAADGTTWQDVNASVSGNPQNPGALRVGPALLVGNNVVRLDDLSVTPSSGGVLEWSLSLETFDGRVVGIDGGNHVVLVGSDGNPTLLEGTVTWTRMIGDGNHGWFYGTSQLRRFDRASAVLGTANYLGQTGMLQVTDMSLSTEGRLRLDGTAANGLPVIVAIDTSSGEISVTTEDLPRLQQLTELQ